MRYPFEYFCGANVVVSLGNMPLLEACGFSYSIRESKRPIFGYSSRHFDAVARGQVLVEGTLLINYVHQDYLFHAARLGTSENPESLGRDGALDAEFARQQRGGDAIDLNSRSGSSDEREDGDLVQRGIDEFWTPVPFAGAFDGLAGTENPHDGGGYEIRVVYGNQASDRPAGDTGLLLRRVHFTGRAKTIQIDAETIVEAYSFFARDISSMRNPGVMFTGFNENSELETNIVGRK